MEIEKLSVNDMMSRIQSLARMSPKQQARIFDQACDQAKKHPMSDEDEALLLGANGYFQDEDGEYS